MTPHRTEGTFALCLQPTPNIRNLRFHFNIVIFFILPLVGNIAHNPLTESQTQRSHTQKDLHKVHTGCYK